MVKLCPLGGSKMLPWDETTYQCQFHAREAHDGYCLRYGLGLAKIHLLQ